MDKHEINRALDTLFESLMTDVREYFETGWLKKEGAEVFHVLELDRQLNGGRATKKIKKKIEHFDNIRYQ